MHLQERDAQVGDASRRMTFGVYFLEAEAEPASDEEPSDE